MHTYDLKCECNIPANVSFVVIEVFIKHNVCCIIHSTCSILSDENIYKYVVSIVVHWNVYWFFATLLQQMNLDMLQLTRINKSQWSSGTTHNSLLLVMLSDARHEHSQIVTRAMTNKDANNAFMCSTNKLHKRVPPQQMTHPVLHSNEIEVLHSNEIEVCSHNE